MSTQDDQENNICAAGGIFATLNSAGLEPEIVEHNGAATNSMIVRLHFMKSRYRITVERVSDDDDERPPTAADLMGFDPRATGYSTTAKFIEDARP